MIYVEVGTVLLIAVATFVFVYSRRRIEKHSPPGPKGLPILGYLPFLGRNPAEKYLKLSKKFGPILKIEIGLQSMIVLNSYDVIQEALLKMPEVFSGRPTNKIINLLSSGNGIILKNYDADYKLHKKFCLSSMKGFGFGKRSMEDKILNEIDHLSEVIKSNGQQSFDCQTNISEAVSNVICNLIFGSRFSYDDENFKSIVDHVNRGFTNRLESFCINLLMVAPGLRHFPPFSVALKRILAQIDEFAGTETSSSTIRWAILLFASCPEVQRKFHEEIKRVIGSVAPSVQHRDGMPYVNAFIQELMRHRTLVPLSVPHATTQNTVFHGYHIPKGQTILPNLWAVHHDPENFENPHDFVPERFINSDGKFKKDPRVIPFSIGPRFCLGEHLARMEVFLFLTSLVQRFQICADPSKPLPAFNDGIFGFAYVPNKFSVSFKPR